MRMNNRTLLLIFGVLLGASLMGLREEFLSSWSKAALAGLAFAIFGMVLSVGRGRRNASK